MRRILILTAKFGDGHNTAALNIRDALHLLSDDVKVEVMDLLEASYGSLYSLARNAHLKVVQYAPRIWHGIYSWIDGSTVLDGNLPGLNRLRSDLKRLLDETEPDCLVSTFPLYGHVLDQLFRNHKERPFRFVTVITDSISVNSAWYRVSSDCFCVANDATAKVLAAAGVETERIHTTGFPVSPLFAVREDIQLPYPSADEPKRVLYIINSGQKKAGKSIERLLEVPDIRLTITVGRDAWLKAKLMERPHLMQSEWGKNTRYLWDHQEQFAPLLDAWEIANRENIFTPVGLKRLPFIANSDFHKPKHIYSWKTLLYCAKEPEAIKACIRASRNVAITLFRKSDERDPARAFADSRPAEALAVFPLPQQGPSVTTAFN